MKKDKAAFIAVMTVIVSGILAFIAMVAELVTTPNLDAIPPVRVAGLWVVAALGVLALGGLLVYAVDRLNVPAKLRIQRAIAWTVATVMFACFMTAIVLKFHVYLWIGGIALYVVLMGALVVGAISAIEKGVGIGLAAMGGKKPADQAS